MKATRTLLIGIILGAVIGWVFGFLRFPYIEKNLSYLVGFISCLAFLALGLILVSVWNKHSLLIRLMGKDSPAQNSNKAIRTYTVIWILVSAFIVIGGLISSFLIYKQNELFEMQTREQNQRIQELSELIESARRSNLVVLMNDILDKVDEELENNPGRTLSDKTVANIIAAFNYSFEPYRYLEGDTLSEKKLSPEKGQLLLVLCTKKIDTASFNKIKLNAHFSGADLRKGDLRGVDLSGADLKDADLGGTDLSGASLEGADLRKANFWGAHADKANLVSADLRRSVLSWAELNGAQLDSANLNGADLSNAQMRNADLHGAKFRAAKLDGALLNEANLEGGDFLNASLQKANLTRANLTNADVNSANFNEAIMTETELTKILLNDDKNWFEKLNVWHITGAKEIQKRYKIVLYESIGDIKRYRLEKI